MKYVSLLIILFLPFWAFTQDTATDKTIITTRLYVDTYYAYDFGRPPTGEKAPFLYNYRRHNGTHVNLALAGISIKQKKTRANVGIMTGTYSRYNLSNEPGLLKHLFEANAGIKLSQRANLWLDAGVMPSHIGFESAIGKDCWTLTRSILAENTPYYESGIKLNYTSNDEKIYAAVLLLNGWQRMNISNRKFYPAFGSQVTYKPTSDLSFNWSTFLGRANPIRFSPLRYLNNFYALYQINKTLGFTAGLDHGFEQQQHGSKAFNAWISPVLITRYQLSKWAFAARIEYYNDKSGIFAPLVDNKIFQMQGYSVNIDRKIGNNILWRAEWRFFNHSSPYFLTKTGTVSTNHSITSSVVIDLVK